MHNVHFIEKNFIFFKLKKKNFNALKNTQKIS